MEKHIFNLCESRGEPRCRIWLERDRLVRSGFTHGKIFSKTWSDDKLTLEVVGSAEGLKRAEFGTVCGSKERPIIDICGAQVKKVFGKSSQYEATFSDGRIVLRRAA
jgi:hypothetical protein